MILLYVNNVIRITSLIICRINVFYNKNYPIAKYIMLLMKMNVLNVKKISFTSRINVFWKKFRIVLNIINKILLSKFAWNVKIHTNYKQINA